MRRRGIRCVRAGAEACSDTDSDQGFAKSGLVKRRCSHDVLRLLVAGIVMQRLVRQSSRRVQRTPLQVRSDP